LLRSSAQVPSPDWRRAESGESAREYALRCAQVLDRHLERHHGETAAVILEPLVQGATGMAIYDAEYLRQARASCDRYDVHLIADEIMTGFGRTGTFFAHEQADITPDFLCLSKGLTGGYLPLAAVLTRDEIYAQFYDDATTRGFLHSHSYTGNALACRAALATLDIFDDDDVIAANRLKARSMHQRLEGLARHPRVRDFRNMGMIWAFEIVSDDPQIGRHVHLAALEREILLRPIGATVYFMPPYVISDEEQEMLAQRTVSILDSLA
jgi:adenosylmethionine-8-amino-7-oxononanoate aminotransferase